LSVKKPDFTEKVTQPLPSPLATYHPPLLTQHVISEAVFISSHMLILTKSTKTQKCATWCPAWSVAGSDLAAYLASYTVSRLFFIMKQLSLSAAISRGPPAIVQSSKVLLYVLNTCLTWSSSR